MMARGIIAHELKDWSQITSSSTIWDELDLSSPDRNFGIHRYNDHLWTSGYVGVFTDLIKILSSVTI